MIVHALAAREGSQVWALVRSWGEAEQLEQERRNNPGLRELMALSASREV